LRTSSSVCCPSHHSPRCIPQLHPCNPLISFHLALSNLALSEHLNFGAAIAFTKSGDRPGNARDTKRRPFQRGGV
jgi:hypothetical protein